MSTDLRLNGNLEGWLGEFQNEIEAAYADFMMICGAAEQNAYAGELSSYQLGAARIRLQNMGSLAQGAPARAARTFFLSCMSKFVSFMDKLIASQRISKEGIYPGRQLRGAEAIETYVREYFEKKIAQVAQDARIKNPDKIKSFGKLPDFVRETSLEYFQLRRALEHHQDVPGDDLNISFLRITFLVDDRKITEMPFMLQAGQVLNLRTDVTSRTFPAGTKVILSPEDVHGIFMMLRFNLAPEIFRVHVESERNSVS